MASEKDTCPHCAPPESQAFSAAPAEAACCETGRRRRLPDPLLWGSLVLIAPAWALHMLAPDLLAPLPALADFSANAATFLNKMWWGLALAIFFVMILDILPRDVVTRAVGEKAGAGGLVRAVVAGVLLDLCSHGILVVGMKLYRSGVRTAQVMAFLIASPWNSLSLTVILAALVGWGWTLAFIGLSMVIAFISGLVFEKLVDNEILPANPNRPEPGVSAPLKPRIKAAFSDLGVSPRALGSRFLAGLKESRMVLRWIFFGVLAAALIRTFVPTDIFQTYFGPTLLGLALTLVAATIIEVCSEGTVPIAADLLTRAAAPGNAFVFLMTGVATDYTEIMAIKDTTGSWKTALFLPLVTVPQVLLLGILINMASVSG